MDNYANGGIYVAELSHKILEFTLSLQRLGLHQGGLHMLNAIMSAKYAQTVNFSQQPSHPTASTPAASKTAADTVKISHEAKFSQLSGCICPSLMNGPISIHDIEDALAKATVDVEERLQTLYSRLGIPPESKMDIRFGWDGSIMVSGENPKADALAKAINEDDALSNALRGMSAKASLLEAVEKHLEFVAAYEKDPVAAVSRYSYLLEDERDAHVSFSMQDGRLSTKIEH